MKIEIPKVVKRIQLSGYAQEFGDAYVEVWVNPPASLLERINQVMSNVRNLQLLNKNRNPEQENALEKTLRDCFEELIAVFAELLSQGKEETRLGVEELKQMVEGTNDTDPMFWAWLQTEVINLINEHRKSAKKG